MITREEFDKAEQVVSDYHIQVNKILIKNHICICCKTKEIKPLENMGLADGYIKASEQDTGCWDNGTVQKIAFGYGSRYDMGYFFIAVCDDCMDKLIEDGLAIDIKKLNKEERKLGL